MSQRTTPEVYDRYLLARQRMYDRSRAALEDALRLLDEAIDKDAEYAPAYAQRGIVAMLLADDSYAVTARFRKMRHSSKASDTLIWHSRSMPSRRKPWQVWAFIT